MNYSSTRYPWSGEGVEKDKESSKWIVHKPGVHERFLFEKLLFHHPTSALLCQHQLSENSQGPTNLL